MNYQRYLQKILKKLDIEVPLNELGFLSIYFSVYLQQLEQKLKRNKDDCVYNRPGIK